MSDTPSIGHNSNVPKNLAEEPIGSEHVLACARVSYETVRDIVESAGKGKWMAQLTAVSPLSCCRDPANYDIEAWYSKASESAPDVYKFYCRVCEERVSKGLPDERGIVHDGCCKVAFCVGGGDYRPMWSVG